MVVSRWRSSPSSLSSQQAMSHDPSSAILIPTIDRTSHLAAVSVSKAPIRSTSTSSSKKYTSFTFSNTYLLILLTTFFLLISTCSAEFYIEERMVEVREDIPDLFASTLARLARSGTILVDQRPDPLTRDSQSVPKPKKQWEITIEATETEEETLYSDSDLRKRKAEPIVATITSTATITPPKISSTVTASVTTSSTSTLASSETSSGLTSAATPTSASLPAPFDSGFTSNITTTCSSFMMNFLANETFKKCLPFSLLLQVCFVLSHLISLCLSGILYYSPPMCTHLILSSHLDILSYHINPIDTKLIQSPPELKLLLPSLQIPRPHNPNPRCLLLRRPSNMYLLNELHRVQHNIHRRMFQRPRSSQSPHNASASGTPRLLHPLHSFLSKRPFKRRILLRASRDQLLESDGFLHLLFAVKCESARRITANMQ